MVKKQRIMEVALELFAEQGFEATSVQQITERCGISKGAFYLSFKTKDDLIIALVDHFMLQITRQIDRTVRNTRHNSQLLYQFYYATFHTFNQYSSFTKIFIKEQSHTLNKAVMAKMHYYNQIIDQTIKEMVSRLYSDQIDFIQYDLIFLIKGLMRTYAELLLMLRIPADLDRLSRSLAEKTDLLAKQMKIPFVTQELALMLHTPTHEKLSKEQIIELIEQKLKKIENRIVRESLQLLKEELISPKYSPAIAAGLIENVRNDPETESIAYLLTIYFS